MTTSTTSTTKIDNQNFIIRVNKKGFQDCFTTVCEDNNKWFVDYNWDNEYDTKEEAIKVGKTLAIQFAENKIN